MVYVSNVCRRSRVTIAFALAALWAVLWLYYYFNDNFYYIQWLNATFFEVDYDISITHCFISSWQKDLSEYLLRNREEVIEILYKVI